MTLCFFFFSSDFALLPYLQVLKPDEPTTEGYKAESVQTVKQRGQDRQLHFWEKV